MTDSCRVDVAATVSGDLRPWAPRQREADALMAGPADPFSCLTEVDLFADLSAQEIEAMDLMAPARLFRRGELLFSQSQPVKALFILKSGRVRIFRVAEDGKALTMAILEPGAVFGEMMLVGQRMYDNYAEAIEDSAICQLSVEEVERFLLSDPRIAIRISRLLGEQVARLEERLTDLALRPLAAQVASTLLKLGDAAGPPRFGQARTIHLTHEQLAGLLGSSREATSKIMGDLSAKKAIRQGRGRIIIQDRDILRKNWPGAPHDHRHVPRPGDRPLGADRVSGRQPLLPPGIHRARRVGGQPGADPVLLERPRPLPPRHRGRSPGIGRGLVLPAAHTAGPDDQRPCGLRPRHRGDRQRPTSLTVGFTAFRARDRITWDRGQILGCPGASFWRKARKLSGSTNPSAWFWVPAQSVPDTSPPAATTSDTNSAGTGPVGSARSLARVRADNFSHHDCSTSNSVMDRA